MKKIDAVVYLSCYNRQEQPVSNTREDEPTGEFPEFEQSGFSLLCELFGSPGISDEKLYRYCLDKSGYRTYFDCLEDNSPSNLLKSMVECGEFDNKWKRSPDSPRGVEYMYIELDKLLKANGCLLRSVFLVDSSEWDYRDNGDNVKRTHPYQSVKACFVARNMDAYESISGKVFPLYFNRVNGVNIFRILKDNLVGSSRDCPYYRIDNLVLYFTKVNGEVREPTWAEAVVGGEVYKLSELSTYRYYKNDRWHEQNCWKYHNYNYDPDEERSFAADCMADFLEDCGYDSMDEFWDFN